MLPAVAAAQAPPARADSVRADSVRADSVRADSVLRLEALRVAGPRATVTAGGTSAVELTVRELDVAAAPRLDDLLRELPMLHLRTNSRGETEVLARGSESRQVAVLLDGVPLTLSWDGRSDVSMVPATGVDALRFSRGLSSMLHGPNVLGGVVEATIAGEHARPPRGAELTAGYDHTGGWGGGATVTLPLEAAGGSLLLRGGASLRDSPGAPLARGVVEPVPGRHGLRVNTDVASRDAFAAARYRAASGAWASLSASTFEAERGIAAELGATAPRFWRYPHVSRSVAVLSGGTGFHRTPLGTGDLELSLGYDVGRSEIVAYPDRRYDEATSFENGDDRTLTLRLLGDHTLGARGDLRAAFTLADVLHDERLPAGAFRFRQRLSSLGGETLWLLAAAAGPLRELRLAVGGAFDHAVTPATGDKPGVPDLQQWGARAGVSALLGDHAQLHFGMSRRGRFPALREAFSGALNRFAPNPALAPERLTAAEAGVTARLHGAQFQAVAFHHRLDDAIVRITLPDRRFMRVNENQVRSTGVELLASWQGGWLSAGGDVALTSAELITPVQRQGRLENQPEVFGSAFSRLNLPGGLQTGATASFTGRQYCLSSSGEDIALGAGTVVGVDASRQWRVRRGGGLLSRAEVRLGVDNVTDTAIYDQCGLPQPGRLARLTLRLF